VIFASVSANDDCHISDALENFEQTTEDHILELNEESARST